MTILLKNRKITILFITGAILLLAGLTIWLYTSSTIQTLQQILQDQNLPQQQQWDYEGELEWWTNTKTAIYDPVALALITTGIIVLLYVEIWAIIQL
jgi:hypothetical protein